MSGKKKLNRLILNFPGFEPTSAIRQIDRLTHGGNKTADLWNFELVRTEASENEEKRNAVANFTSIGDGWKSDIRYVQFSWQDIISRYENAPYPMSFFENFPKYLSFYLDGSVGRYLKSSARYWGFTIYPLLYLITAALVAWLVAYFGLSYFSVHWAWAVPVAILLFPTRTQSLEADTDGAAVVNATRVTSSGRSCARKNSIIGGQSQHRLPHQ